jgi:hypothetical protein
MSNIAKDIESLYLFVISNADKMPYSSLNRYLTELELLCYVRLVKTKFKDTRNVELLRDLILQEISWEVNDLQLLPSCSPQHPAESLSQPC